MTINTDYDAQGDLPEPLRDMLLRSTAYLSDEEERQVTQLLIEYKHVFFPVGSRCRQDQPT